MIIGDLVRSKTHGWIGTIVGFEEAQSRLYGKEKGLLPIIYWSYPEEERWIRRNLGRCNPELFEVINEDR